MFCYKNVGRPLVTTVSNGDRKDTDMKLLLIFAAILAFSLAEEEKKKEELDDSQAEASAAIELMKEGTDLKAAASTYNSYIPPSQRPPHWNAPNYVPQNTWPQEPVKPIQPVQTSVPANVQSDYYDHHYQWTTPPPTTTTPNSVIRNEQYFGDNGYYYYVYELRDGTSAGEEGYFTDPKQTEESLVKKGWYSFVGADHKTYTVKYWADKTGYHAFGDHLPTPPAPPAQPAYDHKKPQNDYPTQTPAPVYYPTKAPEYVPPAPATFAPPQSTYKPYYPPQQQQQNNYPQQNYFPQQTYFPQQPVNQG